MVTSAPPALRRAGSAAWVSASGASTFTSYSSRSASTGSAATSGSGLGPSLDTPAELPRLPAGIEETVRELPGG